jgi:glucose/mannose transport system permease protein
MSTRRQRRPLQWRVHLALLPMTVVAVLGYLFSVVWTIGISFTSSRTFPSSNFVGVAQYERLFNSDRWMVSIHNLALYASLFIGLCLILGFLLAVFIDQKIRSEDVFRSIFLYPYAMSFVVTGLVWQWLLNPDMGIQYTVRKLGFESFNLDWLVNQDRVMYAIVLAAVWQASGLVMAILLSGLRGIDEEIWKATELDGIPKWRVYLSVVLPMIGSSVATAFVLQSVAAIKVYDAVVSMTQGGPGTASEVPAKFILDNIFSRSNIGLASAASVVLLLTVAALVTPWFYMRQRNAAPDYAKRG